MKYPAGEFTLEKRELTREDQELGTVRERWTVRRTDGLGRPQSVARLANDAGDERDACTCQPPGDWCPHIAAVRTVRRELAAVPQP